MCPAQQKRTTALFLFTEYVVVKIDACQFPLQQSCPALPTGAVVAVVPDIDSAVQGRIE